MLPDQKNKMNLRIIEMLRSKGAPAASPFPGEQDFESTDHDLDEMGDVLIAGRPEALEKAQEKGPVPAPKKKKPVPKSSKPTPAEEEWVPADRSEMIGGVN